LEREEQHRNHYLNIAQSRRNLLTDQDQNPQSGSLVNNETTENQTTLPSSKRKFVEPEISQPVDVLEATTFFQVADSGATN
jgi:hypothetical protein